jgi:hypothetical protein
MSGVHLNAFVDLFLGTSQAVLTGPNFILNETQPRNTLLWEFMRAHDMEEMLQGGDTITDQIILDSDNTYGAYNPMEVREPHLSNHLTEVSINWAFTDAYVLFSKHEKGLAQASSLNRGARSYVFKNAIKAKWSNLFININKGMNNEFFATPDFNTMEATTPVGKRVPMSLFVTTTEHGALTTETNPTGKMPPGFTTVQGVSTTLKPLWANPVEFYVEGKAEIITNQRWDGFQAMQSLLDRMDFQALPIRPEYGTVSRPDGFFICSKKGKQLFTYATAKSNDFTRHGPSNAAYPGLNFDGVPLLWKEGMDTAAVWRDATSLLYAGENDDTLDVDGAATTNPEFAGPRFVAVVPRWYKKIMHSEHFLEQETPPASDTQPYHRTVWFDCWHNNWNSARQRATGVVSPGVATIDGFI